MEHPARSTEEESWDVGGGGGVRFGCLAQLSSRLHRAVREDSSTIYVDNQTRLSRGCGRGETNRYAWRITAGVVSVAFFGVCGSSK